MKSPPSKTRGWLLHALRLLIVVVTVTAIHVAHAKRAALVEASDLVAVDRVLWSQWFPEGEQLRAAEDMRVDVVDVDNTVLGQLLQTSPDGDDAIGFSGSSNVLIAVDAAREIVGVQILNSGDTVDHVAAVNEDSGFTSGWNGLSLAEAAGHRVDGVSGATLTCSAANDAIVARLGGVQSVSTRFPEPVSLEAVQSIFPEADAIGRMASPEQLEVFAGETTLGYLVRPTYQQIELLGYQGPTDFLIGLGADLTIVGVTFLKTFDNEPYYGYVVDDDYFRSLLIGKSFPEFHETDLFAQGIEGVSGATMTSMTVADVIHQASESFAGLTPLAPELTPLEEWQVWLGKRLRNDGVAIVAIGIGCALPFLRGRRRVAVIWPIAVLVVLGWREGLLLSQAMFVGWSQVGVSTAGGYGLIVLAAVAFFFPAAAGRNVYCSHLCAHGAAQMLIRNRLPRRWRLPRWLLWPMRFLPLALLAVVVVVGTLGWKLSLVNLEAFDAYLWPVCGLVPVAIAVMGLVASLFEPMAYCRYGCPTGSLLDYVRRHRRSDRWTRVDWAAVLLLSVSWSLVLLA